MKDLYLIGGGGHCKSCIDVIELEGKYQIKGIIDIFEKVGHEVLGYKIVGTDEDILKLSGENCEFLITVGQIKSSDAREKYHNMKLNFATIISPRAHVSKHAEIGKGTIVMHDSLVNAGAKIGKNCIINTKALIEHDGVIEDLCHISTGSIVNGDCIVREKTFIGSNTVLKQGQEIPAGSVIGYGEKA